MERGKGETGPGVSRKRLDGFGRNRVHSNGAIPAVRLVCTIYFYSTIYGVVVVFEVSDPCAGSELRKDRGRKTPSSLISASGTPRWILLILDSFERGDPGGRFGRDEF